MSRGKSGGEPEEGTRAALRTERLLGTLQRHTVWDMAVVGRLSETGPSCHGPPLVPEQSCDSTAQSPEAEKTTRDSVSRGLWE